MKKLYLLTGLSLAFSLVLISTGCKKDNDSSGAGGVNASVNGTAWQSLSILTDADHGSGYITVYSGYFKPGDTSTFTIQVHDSVKVGETDNMLLSTVGYTKITSSAQKYYSTDAYSGHGSLTLTTRDVNTHKISGTFNGVLYNFNDSNDSVKVENGHFNVSYTEN